MVANEICLADSGSLRTEPEISTAFVAKMSVLPVVTAKSVAWDVFVEFEATPAGHKPVLLPATIFRCIGIQEQQSAPMVKIREAPNQVSVLVDVVFTRLLSL